MATSFGYTRPVTVTITGAPMPIDAYKAVMKRVEKFEDKYYYSLNEAGTSVGLTNITNAKAVLTGATPYKVYAFTVSADFATATYSFAFIETAPNTESIVDAVSIAVSPTSGTIAVGGTQQLSVTFTPADTSNKNVTYTTSNPARATVSATGLVTGVATGSAATITATSANGKTATAAITVS